MESDGAVRGRTKEEGGSKTCSVPLTSKSGPTRPVHFGEPNI